VYGTPTESISGSGRDLRRWIDSQPVHAQPRSFFLLFFLLHPDPRHKGGERTSIPGGEETLRKVSFKECDKGGDHESWVSTRSTEKTKNFKTRACPLNEGNGICRKHRLCVVHPLNQYRMCLRPVLRRTRVRFPTMHVVISGNCIFLNEQFQLKACLFYRTAFEHMDHGRFADQVLVLSS